MMKFAIEENIEIPAKRRAAGTESALDQFPFSDMKPGNSFTVPGKKMGDTLRNAASQYAATHDRWFYVTRTVGVDSDSGEVLTRIWRVEENDPRRRVARY